MLKYLNYRTVNLILFLGSVIGMAFAMYLQHGLGFEPCPLCVFQRIGLMGLGLFSLIALIHNPVSVIVRRVYNGLGLIAITWAAGVAAFHVWVQNAPPEDTPSCGPGLDYMLETLPYKEVLRLVFSGSARCTDVDWTFLGLSLPVWSCVFFTVLLVITVWQLIKARRA
ncbi:MULTISPECIES: disulfide bond formation protein B [unclassified Acinetobacter]|uniref:disulfide bond formation protein B n=1 Tax=unclassified Acinetobacter TaxID=196816 RepID=UPI0035B6C35D